MGLHGGRTLALVPSRRKRDADRLADTASVDTRKNGFHQHIPGRQAVKIETTPLKRCNVIKLEGRFDSNTAPAMQEALKASMDSGVYRLVIDMSGVEYFSSAAIRVLIMAFKECRRWNRGDVRLAAVPERIAQVLDLAGILSFIQTYPDTTLAVGSY